MKFSGFFISGLFAALVSTSVLVAQAFAQAEAPKAEARAVIGIFGGLQSQKFRTIIDAYAKPLGIETVYVEGTSNDLLAKVRAQRNNPQIDLFVGTDQTFAVAKSLGLIEKLDPRLVPNLEHIRPEFKDPDGFGQYYEVNSIVLIHRADKFRELGLAKPTSWNVYAEPALKGRVIVFPLTVSYGYQTLAGLAMAAGKSERDIAPAWSAFDRIIANGAVVAATPGQAANMMTQGESWLYAASAEQARLLRQQGAPIDIAVPKDGVIVFPNLMAPVRNAKNPIAAQRILNHYLSKEVQTKLAHEGAVIPVNSQVELTPDMKERLGYARDGSLPAMRLLDVQAINANLDEWVDLFNRRVTKK